MARSAPPAAPPPHVADSDEFKEEFPEIAKIETGDDFNDFVNRRAATTRTSAVENAISVAAAFYQAEAKGLVTWGKKAEYCEKHLQYSSKSITIFRPIFDHRHSLETFAQVFEQQIDRGQLAGLTVEPRSSLRYVLQTIKANNLAADAVKGIGKAPKKMGQVEAWGWVATQMMPRKPADDAPRTTSAQREAALKVLVSYAMKVATMRDTKRREALAASWSNFGDMESYLNEMPDDLIKVMNETLTNIKSQTAGAFSTLQFPDNIADFWKWNDDVAGRHARAEEDRKAKQEREDKRTRDQSTLWVAMREGRKVFAKWGANMDDFGNDEQTFEEFKKCRAVYRQLQKQYHPDTGSKNETGAREINVAWEAIAAYYPQTAPSKQEGLNGQPDHEEAKPLSQFG